MKKDIILAGVGGQGVLSIAAIIAQAAVSSELTVRQSEVHGMAQRGGAVLAHLRIADGPIAGDLIPQGGADLILSMEPLESLRYAAWLAPSGALVSAADPLVNILNYPNIAHIHAVIRRFPQFRLVDAAALAKQAGLPRAVNMIMIGAASPFLALSETVLEKTITLAFAHKASSAADALAVAEGNIKAFRLGRDNGSC